MLYKNWKAITEVKDRKLRFELAMLDMKSEEAAKLTGAYPECFSKTNHQGAIVLSILMNAHHEQCTENPEWDHKDNHLFTHEVIGSGDEGIFDLPIYEFAYNEEHLKAIQISKENYPEIYPEITILGVIPEEIGTDVKFGTTIVFEGNEFFVIENNNHNDDLGIIECVPAEAIIIDCRIPR